MKKIVITGATGMIGNALLHECISNGVMVLAIVRPNSKNICRILDSPLVRIVECDLAELDRLDESIVGTDWDVFYHFGWNNASLTCRNDVVYQSLNIGYTIQAIKLAQKLGCKKFVGAGSQAEYGVLNTNIISPNSPTNPNTAYGIAKYTSGKMAGLWASQNGLDCLWTRIFSVFGAYDLSTTMISSSIRKMLKGERMQFTKGIQLWDYLYSSDAGHAFYLIGEDASGNKVYCLGSGQAKPLHEYIEIIHDIIDPNLEIGIGEIPYGNGEILNLCADIKSLQEDTGFVPKVNFETGISEVISYMKKFNR